MIQKGFTVIELMIVIVIVGIIGFMAFASSQGIDVSGGREVSYGVGGLTETRCIGGYKFVVGGKGYPTQILDSNGHGVSCNGH
jgi:prepilin-type N-terminal cleavage/methylation domain-containing protein